MKAKIEVEIRDNTIPEEDLKLLLAEQLFNIAYDWVMQAEPPIVQFQEGVDKQDKGDSFFKFNWDDQEQ